jgi:hypothetical protein
MYFIVNTFHLQKYKDIFKSLLTLCTTKTPFRNINGDLYIQTEGVSMGNCLAPSFANYYMCHLENMIFEAFPGLKPPMYVRYVDDICVIIPKFDTLMQIKTSLS